MEGGGPHLATAVEGMARWGSRANISGAFLLSSLYGVVSLVPKDEVPLISVSRAFLACTNALSTVGILLVALHIVECKLELARYRKSDKRKKNTEEYLPVAY